MIRKKDLVKQFELIVQQEIIEHNKAISASNLSLNDIRQKVLELSQSIDRQVNKLDNKTINLSYEFESILNSYKTIRQEFVKLVSDNERFNNRNFKEIQIIDQSVETVHRNQQNLSKEFKELCTYFSEMQEEIKTLSKSHENDTHRIKLNFSKELKKQKEEILSLPSEAKKVKEEFMEELSMHKIDNAGLLKEIKVLKKTVFINEKKIENLYTLIDRLNNKINITS